MWTECGSFVRVCADRAPIDEVERLLGRGGQRCGCKDDFACIILARLPLTLEAMNTSRFDKLHVKLFLAIAAAIGALTLGAYYVFTASFERGFIQYLAHADEVRLDSLVERLAQGYAQERSWIWIADDRQRWLEMSRDA